LQAGALRGGSPGAADAGQVVGIWPAAIAAGVEGDGATAPRGR